MSMLKQNETKSVSTTVTHILSGVLWVLKVNGLYHYRRCDGKWVNRQESHHFNNRARMSSLPSSVSNDFKRSFPGANLLTDEKLFSHIYTEPTFLMAFYTSRNLDTCSVLRGLLDIAS